jgi:hypothetical protein
MRATVYLLPVEGNCWISIWTRRGNIGRSWATMDKCVCHPGLGMRPSGGGGDDRDFLGRKPRTLVPGKPIPFIAGRSPALVGDGCHGAGHN